MSDRDKRRVVYFPKPEMCVMWNHEFAGQMSDGAYENDPVTDTELGTKWWWSKAEVGDPTQNDRDCPYILLNLANELDNYRIDRYIAYCILITERPDLLSKFTQDDEIYIEQVASSVWHSQSIFYNSELEDDFEEDFKQQIKYISFEETKAIFEQWSYFRAWCYAMDLVHEMDECIH